MRLVADSAGRIASKELFPPGKPFSASKMPDGSIVLTELEGEILPAVEPTRTTQGFLMLPVKLEREAILRAIRADREHQ